MLTLCPAGSLEGQDLDPADVQVMLDWALHIAQRAAAKRFPGGVDYLLYSVRPRVLKGDSRGVYWQVRWQVRAFPHHRWLVDRLYMKECHLTTERSAQIP